MPLTRHPKTWKYKDQNIIINDFSMIERYALSSWSAKRIELPERIKFDLLMAISDLLKYKNVADKFPLGSYELVTHSRQFRDNRGKTKNKNTMYALLCP